MYINYIFININLNYFEYQTKKRIIIKYIYIYNSENLNYYFFNTFIFPFKLDIF